MSKHLKAFMIALFTVCMTACLGIFAAACNNDPDENKDTFPTSVSITVKLDNNTAAQGVWVQLCVVGENGTLGACLEPVGTDAQGVATITRGIDEANGKIYEVHLTAIPEGYQYVDANGTPYEKSKGVHVDITDPSALTITLAKKVDPSTALTLGTPINAVAGHNYVFTATEEGFYKITVDNTDVNWAINGVTQFNSTESSLTIKANESVNVTVGGPCTLLIAKTESTAEGTAENPKELTLGTTANFTVELVEQENRWGQPDPETGKLPTLLTWEAYHFSFTATTAGTYKVTLTLGLANDDIDPDIYAKDYSHYPDVPESSSNDNELCFTYTLNADTEYIISFGPAVDDYANLVSDGTTSLNYTVKIENV